eukprot:gene10250-12001_t
MNSLFKATRKEPAAASVFKFSFKLGGDEDLEEDAPTKKKNKNKKKKKKPSAGVAEIDNPNTQDDTISPENVGPLDDEVDEMESLLKEVQISVESQQTSLEEDGATNTAAIEEKTLSKSQKKNLQKKKAKKSAEVGTPEDVTSVNDDIPKKIASSQAKPSTKAPKAKEIKPIIESDDEFAIPEPKVSKKNKRKKPEPKAKAKPASVTTKPTGLAFAHLAAAEPVSRGPHFISSKDPELDEATKLRFKYGMGRNLVAIGPAKVRDPNWLPPPPGLTCPTAPMKGVFSKSASPEKKAPVKTSLAAEATEEVHSSPFSFSFNGL